MKESMTWKEQLQYIQEHIRESLKHTISEHLTAEAVQNYVQGEIDAFQSTLPAEHRAKVVSVERAGEGWDILVQPPYGPKRIDITITYGDG